jgi:hypothetical protein
MRKIEGRTRIYSHRNAGPCVPVVEKFRGKYGTGGVNLYSKLGVAVIAHTR